MAICNPLCHYTMLPQGPVTVACSVTLLQSKRFESPAASATGATGALILHWQSGILPLPCDELCPRNGSCKNANAAQSKHRRRIFGGCCWLPLFCSTPGAWLTSGMEPIIVFRIRIGICLGTFVKRSSRSNCFAKFPFSLCSLCAVFIPCHPCHCAEAKHKH